MKFGSVPLDEARGAILAHSQRAGERMIRKGTLLDEAALAALAEAGRTEVICAQLEPGDVPEDLAADRLATPLVSPLIARSRAATGRVNLSAEVPGLLRVDAASPPAPSFCSAAVSAEILSCGKPSALSPVLTTAPMRAHVSAPAP